MINKGKVLSLKKVKSINIITNNKLIILMSAIFIIGVIVSVFSFKKEGSIFSWKSIIENYYVKRSSKTYFKVFIESLLNFITVLVFFFISGTSIIGIGISPAIIFILGFVSGGISSYLYSVYLLKGVAFNSLVILPVCILFFTVCFFAAKTSVAFSFELSRLTLRKIMSGRIEYNKYCTSYLKYLLFTALISIVDMFVSKLLIKLFEF